MCRIKGNRIDILAVHSLVEGRGMFRDFIQKLKVEFQYIRIYEIWNPILETILKNYAFRPFQDVESIEGQVEFVSGMECEKHDT